MTDITEAMLLHLTLSIQPGIAGVCVEGTFAGVKQHMTVTIGRANSVGV